jgi:NADPH-dependent 2,4-dienoyl-CoA reductase/sulfur reductase-like enzyme
MTERVADADVLIVGAGPAGMAAALAAAPSGARIVMIDDNAAPGGQIWRDGPAASLPKAALAQREALARAANVRLRCSTRVVALGGAAGEKALLLEDEQGAIVQRWQRLIIATGARELLLPFPGWTLPGITGAGGLQALIKGGLPVAGQRIVIAGTGPLLLAAAATARAAGARVLGVAEQAGAANVAAFGAGLWRWPGKAVQALGLVARGYRTGAFVAQARGSEHLTSVVIRRGPRDHEVECDRLACGYGLIPNTELGQLLGCALDAGGGLAAELMQQTTVAAVYAAGECTGCGGSERAALQGAIAGHAAVGDSRAAAALQPGLARWQRFAAALNRRFALRAEVRRLARADTLVCRCEDVPHGELVRCAAWVDAKLATRCGMGPCQGRVCGAAAAVLYGWRTAPPRHLLAPARLSTLAAAGAGSPASTSSPQRAL